MGKETVRYPDALVARVEEFVAEAEAFESKSEFHRFASDFLLTLVDPEHDPTVLGYGDIQEDLEASSGVSLQPDDVTTGDGDTPFLESYLTVRRYLLHGEIEEARAYVTETYNIADREALLLDEFIGRFRQQDYGMREPRPNQGPTRHGNLSPPRPGGPRERRPPDRRTDDTERLDAGSEDEHSEYSPEQPY